MGSHRDDDSPVPFKGMIFEEIPNRMERLRNRADEMTARGSNRITGGNADEPLLYNQIHNGVMVRRLPDDSLGVLRVSIGADSVSLESAYLVYRGDGTKVETLLVRALVSLRGALTPRSEEPDDAGR